MEGFLKYREQMIQREKAHSGRDMSNRMRGRSLAVALRLIAQAINNPDTEIEIEDHYPATTASNDHLVREIFRRIDDMKLEGFTLNKLGKHGHKTLKFSLKVSQ